MPKPALAVDWNGVRALAASGISLCEIARRLGISQNTVKARARREKWGISQIFGPGGSAKIPRHIKEPLALAGSQITQVAVSNFHSANSKSRAAIARTVQKIAQHLESLEPDQLLPRCRQLQSLTSSADKVFGWSKDRNSHQDGAIRDELFALSPDQLTLHIQAQETQAKLDKSKPANARLITPNPH
jgi:hypothetical protein